MLSLSRRLSNVEVGVEALLGVRPPRRRENIGEMVSDVYA